MKQWERDVRKQIALHNRALALAELIKKNEAALKKHNPLQKKLPLK